MRNSDWSADVCSSDLFYQDGGDRGDRFARCNQSLFDGEIADAGQDVAAVLPVVDARLVDEDLGEKIVDVDARALRRLDDGDLAGQRIGAADAVDLARIGRAHDRQQQRIARGLVRRQVAREEVGHLRGAAANQGGGNTGE